MVLELELELKIDGNEADEEMRILLLAAEPVLGLYRVMS